MSKTNGRVVAALPAHTFKDSGITVSLRKLGPSVMTDLQTTVRKEWQRSDDPDKQEPKPPLAKGVGGELEPNPADPDYATAHAAWTQRVMGEASTRLLTLAALYSVECEVDMDAVARLRAAYKVTNIVADEDAELTQEQRDRIFYVTRILCATADDLRDLSLAVVRRSTPSEEGVQAHIATFQGDVEGA